MLKTNIIILGIDTISKKNTYQLNACNNFGYKVTVFSNDRLKKSSDYLSLPNVFIKLEETFSARFFQVYRYLKANKTSIHHVELYPGGRFIYVYFILVFWLRLKSIVVERGELVFWNKRTSLQKFFVKYLYRFPNFVWYREPYMLKILDKMKVKHKKFVHNCCDLPNQMNTNNTKNIDFLWVNRLMIERKVEWVFQYLANHENFNTTIIGNLNDDQRVKDFFATNSTSKIKVEKYLSPESYFQRARFFLLPSDIVFANNALLEAMSYGLVPLVSKVSGAELIIDHLVSGYIFEHNYKGFTEAIDWAMNLSETHYEEFSKAAQDKIKRDFSFQRYQTQYKEMIESLNN